MSAVIKYIDKAGLDEIFRIIAEKDKDTLVLLNALSEKIQDIKKNMLTIDNFEKGFTKAQSSTGDGINTEYVNTSKISVGLISPSTDTVNNITKLLSIKEQGIDYTEVPTLDAGEYQ